MIISFFSEFCHHSMVQRLDSFRVSSNVGGAWIIWIQVFRGLIAVKSPFSQTVVDQSCNRMASNRDVTLQGYILNFPRTQILFDNGSEEWSRLSRGQLGSGSWRPATSDIDLGLISGQPWSEQASVNMGMLWSFTDVQCEDIGILQRGYTSNYSLSCLLYLTLLRKSYNGVIIVIVPFFCIKLSGFNPANQACSCLLLHTDTSKYYTAAIGHVTP